MRIALLVHGLPPDARTGVETHVAALARALARAGANVSVLAASSLRDGPHLSLRREREGGAAGDWSVDRLVLNEPARDALEEADPPGAARAVASWLARLRPDVLHVHHVRGFGWEVFSAARALGVPCVFTAHDYHAVCHRVTLLRPDLARCDTPFDAERCARCDRAADVLNARPELGDWHMGAFADQLDAPTRERLRAALDERAGESWVRARAAADRARAEALRGVEHVLAPSARLEGLLLEAGVDRARLSRQPYAVELSALGGLPEPCGHAGPLRLGFLGGLSKHKGAHVLLEAFAGLRGARLTIHGDSTDRPYVARVRALCDASGARFAGAYDARELRGLLGDLDLLCVPSLWEENAPFVIREAFAAGRPVLASRSAALEESVRDGVDGLCLPAGDAGAWRAKLQELCDDREAVRALARGVRPPPDLDAQARELLDLYARLAREFAAEERAPESEPAHLAPFRARCRELERTPLEDLRARVARGLLGLLDALGDTPRARVLARELEQPGALARAARDRARDARQEAAWVRQRARDDEAARAALASEGAWLRGVLAAREEELEWRRSAARESEQSSAAERAEARARLEALELERAWLSETMERLREERDWLRGLEGARDEERAERERLFRAWSDAQGELGRLLRHERWLSGEVQGLARSLDLAAANPPQSAGAASVDGPSEPGSPGLPGVPQSSGGDVADIVRTARARLDALLAELTWRRRRMDAPWFRGARFLEGLVGRQRVRGGKESS